jgi:hypothetical protein
MQFKDRIHQSARNRLVIKCQRRTHGSGKDLPRGRALNGEPINRYAIASLNNRAGRNID